MCTLLSVNLPYREQYHEQLADGSRAVGRPVYLHTCVLLEIRHLSVMRSHRSLLLLDTCLRQTLSPETSIMSARELTKKG